jgi:hypothetical protein
VPPERRDTGISEGRLDTGVALIRDSGRGICDGEGVYNGGAGMRRSDMRGVVVGVMGAVSSSVPTMTQASSVRSRLGMRGRSASTDSIERTP